VHKKPPHQNKQVLKKTMQLFKFGYGRVDKVTYWVNHPLGKAVLPKWNPFLKHVETIIWMGERLLGMGFMKYKGS
jgi:hypothetical protein